MSEIQKGYVLDVRPEVARFALDMEAKLRKRDGQYNGNSWKVSPDTPLKELFANQLRLLSYVREEVNELSNAIRGSATDSNIAEETVDVANYAMMIHDNSGTGAKYNLRHYASLKQDEDQLKQLVRFFNSEEGMEYGNEGDNNEWTPVQCAIETIKKLHANKGSIDLDQHQSERVVLRTVAICARRFPDIELPQLEELVSFIVFGVLFPEQ